MEDGRGARWLLALIAVLLQTLACGQEAPSEPKSADLLLLTLDTTRADVLGCYGGPAATPSLDGLAADALVFENLFSVGFGTSPSHASLFTSRHPSQHGVHDNSTPLPSGLVTLAEVLRRAGYRTAAFVSAVPVRSQLGFDQGFEHFDESFSARLSERRAGGTVDAYLDWLSQDRGDRPTFAWIHLYDPHQPYDPPAAFAPAEGSAETHALFADGDGKARFLFPEDLEDIPEPRLGEIDRIARLRYRGEIGYLDSEIERILEATRRRGRYDTTLILVVSDHGESFLADGFEVAFRHQELRASVSRLVGLLKLTENRHGGRRIAELAGSLDLGPTLLELMGLPIGDDWSGRSLVPWIDEGRSMGSFRDSLVLEGSDPPLVAIRNREWAYVEPRPAGRIDSELEPDSRHQLYDLENDPLEMSNLHGQNPEQTARLRSELREFLTRIAAEPAGRLDDEQHREMLRSLGYLD